MDTTTVELCGVPGAFVVIGVTALIEQAVPAVGRYAGLLSIAIATGVGALALYLAGGPIQTDVPLAVAWALSTVAIHSTVIKPLKSDSSSPVSPGGAA